MPLIPVPKNCDLSVRMAIQKLASSKLGKDAIPVFAGLTLSGLTASRIVATDADKKLTSLADPLIVALGGTGAVTLTDHGILLGSGTDAVTPLGAATHGQLPIGSTDADPVLAEITGTANQIISTPGAGTITLSLPQDIHTGASPVFAGLTVDSPTFYIDSANDRVGVGTVTPEWTLDVVGGGDLLAAQSVIQGKNYSNTYNSRPVFAMKKARGTEASPIRVNNNDWIGSFQASGWRGDSFYAIGGINFEIDGTYSANTRPPGRITISTGVAGGAHTEAMRIDSSQKVGIGKTPTTLLDVNGVITATGGNSTEWNLGYDHSLLVAGNPHSVTPAELGLVIGTNVQTWDTQLDDLATITATAAELDAHLALENEHIDWTAASASLVTTGDGTFNKLTLTEGQNYLFTRRTANQNCLSLQSQTDDQIFSWDMHTKKGDGGDSLFLTFWLKGLPTDISVREFFQFVAINTGEMRITSGAAGAGTTVRPIIIYTGSNINQLHLANNGYVGVGTVPAEKCHVSGIIRAEGGFNYNGTDGVNGQFEDNNNNTVTVSGGIITNLGT